MAVGNPSKAKGKARDVAREARWRRLVTAQAHSGRNVRAYCRERGLSESAFWFWKRELARRDTEERSDRTKNRKPKRKRPPRRPAFVPVSLASATSVAPLEVVLTGGVSVRVSAGCEEASLRMVLEVLGSGS